MARGILTVGFSKEEILSILDTVKTELLTGKSIVNYSAEGVSINKTLFAGMRPQEVLDECRFALRKINPEAYPSPKTYVSSVIGGQIIL